MARKQVIVQLDDKLVAELDEAAAQEGVSRSELIRRVVPGSTSKIRKLEKALVDAYMRVPQDPVLVETARRLAAETTPNW